MDVGRGQSLMDSRTTWQKERRAETRDRLLEAAHRVFARSGYSDTTVNDILVEAEIGRTSFYKHFSDKLAVAESLFVEFMPDLTNSYLRIAKSERLDHASIAAWLDGLVSEYMAHAPIMRVFAQVQSIEPGFGEAVGKAQRDIIRGLGARFPSFARAHVAGDTTNVDSTRAIMTIDMIDHLCSTIAIRQVPLNRREAVVFLADRLLPILIDCPSSDNLRHMPV